MSNRKHRHGTVPPGIKRLRKMSDAELRALTDDEFWDAIEPRGICHGCDPRLTAEAKRRGGKTLREQGLTAEEWTRRELAQRQRDSAKATKQ